MKYRFCHSKHLAADAICSHIMRGFRLGCGGAAARRVSTWVQGPDPRWLLAVQTLARVVETTERHFKAAGRRSGLPLPPGPIEDRDYFRLWPKVFAPAPANELAHPCTSLIRWSGRRPRTLDRTVKYT